MKKKSKTYLTIFFLLFISVLLGFVLKFLIQRFQKVPPLAQGVSLIIEQAAGPRVRLLALGDTGTGNKQQLEVAKAMESYCKKNAPLDGILLLGDNFYMHGVESTEDPQWQQKIERPYSTSPCLKKLPIFAVLGNHDYRGSKIAQFNYHKKNARWHMPHRFYRVNFGSLINLIAFDSNFTDYCFGLSKNCAGDFLFKQLEDKPKSWNLVMAHHPIKSASQSGYSHRGGILGFFMRPLLCHKADAWLSGHAHHLEHRKIEGCRLQAFVAGTGGGDLYPVLAKKDHNPFAISKLGFIAIEATKDFLNFKLLDTKLNILHQTEKQAS